MQKSLIALAVLSAIATTAQAQSSATIHGTIDTGIAYSNKAFDVATDSEVRKLSITPGITQGSYIGFKGVEDLGSGLKASFELETGFSSNVNQNQPQQHGSPNFFRQKSVVGLESDHLGSVLIGIQPGVIDDFNQSIYHPIGQPADHNLDFSKSVQSKNSIRYNTPNISGLSGSLTYGFSETSGPAVTGESFGVGGKYVRGSRDWYAAYYQAQKATTAGGDPKDINGVARHTHEYKDGTFATGNIGLRALSIGTGYHDGPAYYYTSWSFLRQPLAMGFSTNEDLQVFHPSTGAPNSYTVGTDNNSKASILKLGVDYSMTKDLHLIADTSYQRSEYLCDESENPAHLLHITLGADYSLSKRTNLYAFASNKYAHEQFNPGVFDDSFTHEPNQTSFAIGVRHKL